MSRYYLRDFGRKMLQWIRKTCFKKPSNCLCLRDVFKPLYIVLSVMGLFPYTIKFKNSKHAFSFICRSIYFNAICALSYILTICTFLIIHIQDIYFSRESNAMTEGIMTQINYIAEIFGIFIFCIVAYVCVFFNRYKYVKIMNMLGSRIDAPNPNSKKVLYNLRFQVNVIALGFLALTLVMQMCVNFTRGDSLWKMLLVVFTFNLPQTIQFTAIAFFYTLIMMAVGILKNVREQMLILGMETTVYTHGLTKVKSKQAVLTLKQMEQIYKDVSEIKDDVNKVFEAPILVTMMQCFHALVSESHIIYHGVVVRNNLQLHEIVNCSIWIVYQLMKIYAIAKAGNEFKVEALKLGRAIHNISTERQDMRFMMDIQHFSTIMFFQENELTAYGFFPLDATLIFKIISSAAMYTIILVQFDKGN